MYVNCLKSCFPLLSNYLTILVLRYERHQIQLNQISSCLLLSFLSYELYIFVQINCINYYVDEDTEEKVDNEKFEEERDAEERAWTI